MNNKLLRALAIQLQNAAYSHGYIDANDLYSDEKCEKAFNKSQNALGELLERVSKENYLLIPLDSIDKATKDYLIMILENSEIFFEENLNNE